MTTLNATLFSSLVSDMYQCAMEGRLPDLLESTAEVFKSSKAFIGYEENLIINHSAQSAVPALVKYLEKLEQDPFFDFVTQHPLGAPVQLTNEIRKKVKDSSVWESYQAVDTEYILGVQGIVNGRFVSFALNRGKDAKDYSKGDNSWVRLLSSHLYQSIMLSDIFQDAYVVSQSIRYMVETCGSSACTLDPYKRVTYMNEHLESGLNDIKEFSITRGKFVFSDDKVQKDFDAAIDRAINFHQNQDISLKSSMIVLRVMPLSPLFNVDIAFVYILSPKKKDVSWAQQMFLLTPRELDLLVELVEGKGLKEIADEKSLSYHTIRRHLSAILQKTETNSQTELLVKIKKYY